MLLFFGTTLLILVDFGLLGFDLFTVHHPGKSHVKKFVWLATLLY